MATNDVQPPATGGRRKAAISFTGGKDSMTVLHLMKAPQIALQASEGWDWRADVRERLAKVADCEVACLVTFVPGGGQQPFKAHSLDLMELQARALGLPHLRLEVSAAPTYLDSYRAAIASLKESHDVTVLATGDILDVCSNFMPRAAAGTGVELISPLWGIPRHLLLELMWAYEMTPLITCVNTCMFIATQPLSVAEPAAAATSGEERQQGAMEVAAPAAGDGKEVSAVGGAGDGQPGAAAVVVEVDSDQSGPGSGQENGDDVVKTGAADAEEEGGKTEPQDGTNGALLGSSAAARDGSDLGVAVGEPAGESHGAELIPEAGEGARPIESTTPGASCCVESSSCCVERASCCVERASCCVERSAEQYLGAKDDGDDGDNSCHWRHLLGRVLDRRLHSEVLLPAVQRYGVDECGELGEFHTMVTSSRLFSGRVELVYDNAVQGEYAYLALTSAELVAS